MLFNELQSLQSVIRTKTGRSQKSYRDGEQQRLPDILDAPRGEGQSHPALCDQVQDRRALEDVEQSSNSA